LDACCVKEAVWLGCVSEDAWLATFVSQAGMGVVAMRQDSNNWIVTIGEKKGVKLKTFKKGETFNIGHAVNPACSKQQNWEILDF
jgi:hypothetical protein